MKPKFPTTNQEQSFWGNNDEGTMPGFTWSKTSMNSQHHHQGYQTRLPKQLVANGFLKFTKSLAAKRAVEKHLRDLRLIIDQSLLATYGESYTRTTLTDNSGSRS
ncbi:hypothetical protein BJX70DRAFT_377739 [Aspergillus crustosus]